MTGGTGADFLAGGQGRDSLFGSEDAVITKFKFAEMQIEEGPDQEDPLAILDGEIVLLAGLTWVPLVVCCAIEGTLLGVPSVTMYDYEWVNPTLFNRFCHTILMPAAVDGERCREAGQKEFVHLSASAGAASGAGPSFFR